MTQPNYLLSKKVNLGLDLQGGSYLLLEVDSTPIIKQNLQNKLINLRQSLKDQKIKYSVSDFQKSERDFAFIVDKKINVQNLVSVISNIDKNLISNIKVFDVYEGDNIPENKKSVAISVTIQSLEKTLTDNDLEKTNNLIIETVENKTGAKIRS